MVKNLIFLALFSLILVLTLSDVSSSSTRSYIKRCLKNCAKAKVSALTCFEKCSPKTVPKEESPQALNDETTNTPAKPVDPVSDNLIWASYRDQLFSFFRRGGSTKGLQLLRKPIESKWDVEKEQLSTICNRIPFWGAEYKYNLKTSVFEEYGKFLNNINVSSTGGSLSAEDEKRLSELKAQVKEIEDRMAKQDEECIARYNALYGSRSNPRYTLEEFKKARCRYSTMDEFNLISLRNDIFQISGKTADSYADIKAALKNFNDVETYDWTETFSSSLAKFKSNIQNEVLDPFEIAVAKTALSKAETTTNVEWKWTDVDNNKESKSNSFVSVDGRAQAFSFSTSKDDFRLNIKATSHSIVSVAPSTSWFSKSILTKYNQPKFMKDKNLRFFGESGSFPMIVKKLYVLYRPSVSLQLTSEDAQQIQVLARNGKSMSIGPFEINSKTIKVTPVEGKDDLVNVQFSGSGEPHLVATDNEILP